LLKLVFATRSYYCDYKYYSNYSANYRWAVCEFLHWFFSWLL